MDSAPVVQSQRSNGVAPAAPAVIARPDLPKARELYRYMWMARTLDRVEMELVNRGEGFFHVGGAGHEASVGLVNHLTLDDYLYPHYRDKALMLARGIPVEQFFHGLLCTAEATSHGRQMGAHLSFPEVKILPMAGPVGNNALPSVGVAQQLVADHRRRHAGRNGDRAATADCPIVVCVSGDSSTQQGEFLEGIAEAVRSSLPVLFLIEDNGYGISTRTAGRTFYHRPSGPVDEFYGLPLRRLDGRDALACEAAFGEIIAEVRTGRPAIVLLEVERLTHHTNADDERVYREEAEIRQARATADPITLLRQRLLASGVAEAQLAQLESEIEREVRAAAERALVAPNPVTNLDARAPECPNAKAPPKPPGEVTPPASGSYTMLEAMREVLRRHLADDARVTMYGEDIEDPKGDVFGLTRGLSRAFPEQVKNSPLSESTIVGVSLGRAMAGGRPVACIQFADFIPLAFNQLACELGSTYWRSYGGWKCPVVILAPGGAYRPGLGPYHAHTFESVVAHIPGLDVVMPSCAADAAGLLNAALANQSTGRPTVFLYPKVCLNDPALAAPETALEAVLQPGHARFVTRGSDLTLVTWGSTVPLCQRAAHTLHEAGVGVDLIDLRSLSPWDRESVITSVGRTGRLIVVHEDNQTCGFGAEVVSTVTEASPRPFQARRVVRPDTYPPCNYLNQMEVLPSFRRVLGVAAELCDLELKWVDEASGNTGVFVLEAVGSSPADQSVSVVEWKVTEGQCIRAGDLVADCEADKATFELRAPVAGVIRELRPVDDKVPVGTPLAKITSQVAGPALLKRVPTDLKPVLSRRSPVIATSTATPASGASAPAASVLRSDVVVPDPAIGRRVKIGISAITAVPAGRVMTNDELIQRFPGRTAHDIYQRTGIVSRRLLAPGESALTLATRAARAALDQEGMKLVDLDAIVVSTSTPMSISPSMACLLHHALSQGVPSKDVAASDIFAACTGYLYALQTAFDYCRSKPDANILVVTAEAMSEYTNPNDFDTAIVFGDAATATIVHGPGSPRFAGARAHLHRPVLSARGEDGTILNHGRRVDPNVNMDGLKVFPMAVRQLIALLKEACVASEIAVEDLAYIVPHQANGRILDAVDQRLKLPKGRLVNRVRDTGNTSSSTIPIVLSELLSEGAKGTVGLCAFGGGFTFGAAVMEFF